MPESQSLNKNEFDNTNIVQKIQKYLAIQKRDLMWVEALNFEFLQYGCIWNGCDWGKHFLGSKFTKYSDFIDPTIGYSMDWRHECESGGDFYRKNIQIIFLKFLNYCISTVHKFQNEGDSTAYMHYTIFTVK